MAEGKRVLVTGVSGFVGGHVAKLAAERGYKVRGTVRNLSNEPWLKELVPNIELVCLDLVSSSADEWNKAAEGCDCACHVASPFPIAKPSDEMELITPAVEGTKKVLAACHAAGMKRVVITSSIVAVNGQTKEQRSTFSADDWSVLDRCEAYAKSKTMAERAAREYAKEVGMEIASVNPSYIQGPMLHSKDASSAALMRRLMEGDMPAVPPVGMNVCDVRDIALAHLLALEKPDAAGGRFIVDSGAILMTDIAKVAKDKFPAWSVPSMQAPYFVMWVMSCWDKEIAAILGMWKKRTEYDTSPCKNVLGMELRSTETALTDMGSSLEKLAMLNLEKKKTNKVDAAKG